MINRFTKTRQNSAINGKIGGRYSLHLTAALVLLALSSQAQQRSITDTTFSLKEVIVTERTKPVEVGKISVPLKYTPLTISSISIKQQELQGVTSINDALRNVTGIKPVMTYGGFQTFTIRGFGSPVLMVDGQRDERMNYSSSAPIADITSVESVELLKGPASVLYGHSAVGGILNIVRKAPTDESHANGSISYGSWDNKRATFGASGRLVKGVNFRTDIGTSNRQGWRDNNDKRFSAYLALGIDIAKSDKLELRLGYVDDFYGTETGIPTVAYDIYDKQGGLLVHKNTIPGNISREQRFNDPSDFLKNKSYNATLKYAHSFSNALKISNTASFINDDINYLSTEVLSYLTSANPIYGSYYLNNGAKTYISLDTLRRTSPLRFSHKTQTIQNQLELEWKVQTGRFNHAILAGWSMMYLDRTSYTGYNNGVDVYGAGYLAKVATVNPVLNQGALLSKFSKANPLQDFTNGFYIQDVVGVSDKLKLMLAGRFDHFGYQSAGSVPVIDGGRSYLHSPLSWDKASNSALTYRLGAVYLPTPDLSLYSSFATFFKPYRTVYNSTYIYINSDGKEFFPTKGGEIFKPEQGYQAEVGVRYERQNLIRFNASAFYIHKENIRENLGRVTVDENGTSTSKTVMAQVGVVNSKGADAELLLMPIQGISFNAGYTFTLAEYGNFQSNPYVSGDSRKGNQQTYTPKHLSFANLSYSFASINHCSLMVGLGVTTSSQSYTNATNTISLPSYAVANAFASLALPRGISVNVAVRNIFDKTYYEWALGSNQFIPSEGVGYQLTLSYSL